MATVRPPEFVVKAAYARSIISQKEVELMKTPDMMAKSLVMGRATYYRKRKNPAEFTVGELQSLARLLKLSDEELLGIVRGKRQ